MAISLGSACQTVWHTAAASCDARDASACIHGTSDQWRKTCSQRAGCTKHDNGKGQMIRTALGLAMAALLGFVPLSGAQAAPVTWAYTGVVSIETGTIFTVGQVVTGTFVFDNATPLSSGPANYAGAVRSFSID